jgi:hypothetical protein
VTFLQAQGGIQRGYPDSSWKERTAIQTIFGTYKKGSFKLRGSTGVYIDPKFPPQDFLLRRKVPFSNMDSMRA